MSAFDKCLVCKGARTVEGGIPLYVCCRKANVCGGTGCDGKRLKHLVGARSICLACQGTGRANWASPPKQGAAA